MQQRPRAVTGQNQEARHAEPGNQIQREQQHKLDDLPQGEGPEHCLSDRFAEPDAGVRAVLVGSYGPRGAHEVLVPLGDEHRVEHVDLRLVDEKGLKQHGRDGGAFPEHEHGAIEPGAGAALEYGEQEDLRQVGEGEEDGEDEAGEEDDGK